MEAKELRIGNLVYATPYNTQVVEVNIYHLADIDGGIIEIEKNNIKYQPIPLTEEWLLKLGFKNCEELFGNVGFYYIHSYCKNK